MRVTVERAELWHAEYIANRCRPADVLELAALGVTPYQAMRDSLHVPGLAYTGMVDGEPVCMFGACEATMVGNLARPWMVGSTLVEKYQLQFLRRNRKMLGIWLDLYTRLENYVDVRNTQAIKWLRWLGFEFTGPQPLGPYRTPFYRFSMSREG